MKNLVYSFFMITLLSGCTSAPGYKGPKSDHFDGEVFINPTSVNMKKSFWDLLKWQLFSDRTEWPEWIDEPQKQVESKRVRRGELSITFINHSSILIQIDELNILTDPHFGKRASPFTWVGPKRVRNPGIQFEDLPPIDIVLISHNHYDHLDLETLKRLQKKSNPLILSGLGNGLLFKENKLENYKDMDWEDKYSRGSVEITYEPCQHWSARGLRDRFKTLWGAFGIKSKTGLVYFGGDSGYGPHFKKFAKKHGNPDVSLIPVGGYEPRWFMKESHVNPEEAVMSHRDLGSKLSIGIHFGTFQLTNEGINVPIEELAVALNKFQIDPAHFKVLEFGESLQVKSLTKRSSQGRSDHSIRSTRVSNQ